MSALELDRGKPERIYDDDGDIDDREIAIAMGEKEKDNFFLAGDDQPALGSLPASKAVNINKPRNAGINAKQSVPISRANDPAIKRGNSGTDNFASF